MTYKKNRVLLGMLLLIFAFFVLLVLFSIYTLNVLKSESVSFASSSGKEGAIAVITIEGAIMSSKKVIELLHEAEKDKAIQAIIVRIESPGGAVGPSQEIYEEIRRIDGEYESSEGKKGRPIYASFGSQAASGGYYVGAAARKIYANPGTLTGSIGVIFNFMNLSELYQWAHIRPDVIKAGRYKDAGGDHRALTDEERALFNKTLGEVRQQFIRHIQDVRKKRIKGDINEIAQGQIFTGERALEIGLIDELASLWTAGRKIHEELELKGEFGLKFIREKKKTGVWRFLEQLDEVGGRINRLMDHILLKTTSGSALLAPSLGTR